MTLRQLNEMRYLKKEVEYCKQKIEELRREIGSLGSVNLSGMPKGVSLISQPEREAERLEKAIEDYREKYKRYRVRLAAAERFIDEIDDSFLRCVFRLRFVEGKSWRAVAFYIGGGNTAGSVRKACERYIAWVEKQSSK